MYMKYLYFLLFQFPCGQTHEEQKRSLCYIVESIAGPVEAREGGGTPTKYTILIFNILIIKYFLGLKILLSDTMLSLIKRGA